MSEGCGEQPVMWKIENKIKKQKERPVSKMSNSQEEQENKELFHSGNYVYTFLTSYCWIWTCPTGSENTK